MLNIIIYYFNFNLLFIYFSTSHVASHIIICYFVLLGSAVKVVERVYFIFFNSLDHAFNKLTYLLVLESQFEKLQNVCRCIMHSYVVAMHITIL